MVVHLRDWFPWQEFRKFYMAIHSPNSLPDSKIGKNFMEFDYKGDYLVTYSKINIDRLDSSYDTKCIDYDIDYIYANFNMKSDCIASCYQTMMRDMCDLQGYLVKSPFMLRKDRIENEEYHILKDCPNEEDDFKVITQCTNQCRDDCKFKYFLFDSKTIKRFDHLVASIFIRHNGMPDVFIRHIPEITSLSFISNFGGLLGMWLGLSLLTMFNNLTIYFYKLLMNINNNVKIDNFQLNYFNTTHINTHQQSNRRSHQTKIRHFINILGLLILK